MDLEIENIDQSKLIPKIDELPIMRFPDQLAQVSGSKIVTQVFKFLKSKKFGFWASGGPKMRNFRFLASWQDKSLQNVKTSFTIFEFFDFYKCSRISKWLETCQRSQIQPTIANWNFEICIFWNSLKLTAALEPFQNILNGHEDRNFWNLICVCKFWPTLTCLLKTKYFNSLTIFQKFKVKGEYEFLKIHVWKNSRDK